MNNIDQELNKIDQEFALLSGNKVKIDENISIYPLTLKEISEIGYAKYNDLMAKALIVKEMMTDLTEEQLETLNDFDLIVANCSNENDTSYRDDMELYLSLITKKIVTYIDSVGMFLVKTLEDLRETENLKTIDRRNWERITEIIRLQNNLEHPKSELDLIRRQNIADSKLSESSRKRLQELRKKRTKGKKQLADAKGMKTSLSVNDVIQIVATYMNSYSEVFNLTLYQLYRIYNTLSKKDDYEHRFASYLEGGDFKKLKIDVHWTMDKD